MGSERGMGFENAHKPLRSLVRLRALPFHSLWCSGDATAMSDAVSRTQCCIAVPSSSLQSARRLLTLVVATFCMAYAWDP